MSLGIVWFRRDLRLEDNPAWADATARHERVVPLYVVDPALWEAASDARRAFLAGSLRELDRELDDAGGRLRVATGAPRAVVPELARSLGAADVTMNGDVTPYATRRDRAVSDAVDTVTHDGLLVHPPGSVLTNDGGIYRVFTPFSRAWFERDLDPWPEPGDAAIAGDPGGGVPDAGRAPIEPGARAAQERLAAFEGRVDRYREERDRPDLDSTSRLSIDLKWGTVAARAVLERIGTTGEGRRAFVRQLAWRDFYAHLMAAAPRTVREPMRTEYAAIDWNDDPDGLEAWKGGRTGYPLVDAGMRQLRAEGWMHNRVRMVAASFLVKDLLVDWRLGERHFRHLLLDGDVAQNVGNWQWTAGTGADAAPYFRIFNPVTQSQRFDPEGAYIRRWVPELRRLPAPLVHAPWEAGPLELAEHAITLGETYPEPIVDHAGARERTLAAYERARKGRLSP